MLTAIEGVELELMAEELIKRYSNTCVSTPKLLYVDRNCSEGRAVKVQDLFTQWVDLLVRLYIWHFMRFFAVGCITEAHLLYGIFLGRLSQSTFQWSNEDKELLKKEKMVSLIQVTRPLYITSPRS